MFASPREKRDFQIKLAAALLIGLALFAVMPLGRMMRAQNDFAHWYIGALLFGTPDLHSEPANQQLQRQLIGGILDHSYFIRPTFYGLLLKPLAWLPYLTAYWLYQLFSLGICVVYALRQWGRQWPDIYVFAAMSMPLISNFVNGQDVTTLLLLCTLSIMLARRGHEFAAGLVFSLCAIKFHLFILTPLAMIFHKRWRLFWGAVAGEVVLFLAGLAFGGGWKVFMSLVALLNRQESHPYPELMPNVRGMLFAIFGKDTVGTGVPALILASLLVIGAVVYLAYHSVSYEKAFAWCLLGGMIVNFHSYVQDPLLLLMIAAILFDGTESLALGLTLRAAMFPVVYILLMWQPPYSAAYSLLIVAVLAIAVRDQVWRPSPASLGLLSEPANPGRASH